MLRSDVWHAKTAIGKLYATSVKQRRVAELLKQDPATLRRARRRCRCPRIKRTRLFAPLNRGQPVLRQDQGVVG